MNPEASVPDANANSPGRSRIARSTVPPAAKAPYVPFGTPPAQAPVGSAPSTSYLPFGSSNPLPAASAAPKPSAIASILGDRTLSQESPQAPSERTHEDTRGRRDQIAAGNQGVVVASQNHRNNFRTNLDHVTRERAEEQDAAADQVSPEDARSRSHSSQNRGRGRGDGQGDHSRGRSRGNCPGGFGGLSPDQALQ